MVVSTVLMLALLAAGLLSGLLAGWVLLRGRLRAQQAELGLFRSDSRNLQEDVAFARASSSANEATARAERERAERLEDERSRLLSDRQSLERECVTARTELAEERKQSAEKLSLLIDARQQLSDQFKVLADEILEQKSKRFTEQNQANLGQLLKPVAETLKDLTEKTQALETKREGAYSEVRTLIETIQNGQADLRKETSHLVQALRAPGTRGNWGEEQLQSCVEFAGMVEHCTFDLQYHLPGEDEQEKAARPDLIVRLPNDRCIVVDAKTPLTPFLEAMEAQDVDTRRERLKLHAQQVRRHIDDLRKRKYWERVEYSADFVVCFLPSEALFSAALEGDPELIKFGTAANVVLATPTTLIALLKAVAYGWQQMQITRDAVEIRDTAEQLYKKLASAQSHLVAMGKSIGNAAGQYNKLLGALEGRGSVFSQGRKLHNLGIGTGHLEPTDPLETAIRQLTADDWLASPNPE